MFASITMKKVEKIRQIVKLKLVMKRWKAVSLKHGKLLSSSSDIVSEEKSETALPLSAAASSHHHHIPLGFLAVYVGPGGSESERERFLIPTRFLNLPIFKSLLKRAEEEYGFNFSGGITLPCEADFFRLVLKHLEKDELKYGRLDLDKFLKKMLPELTCTDTTTTSFDSSCSKQGLYSSPCHAFTPMLTKTRV